MAVVLRLSRAGAKKAPFYHIVAADSRTPRDGKFLEQVGTWHPGEERLLMDQVKVDKWIKAGAVASETVQDLISKARADAPKA